MKKIYCPHCNQKYEMDDNVTEFICLSCGMKSTESGYFEKHKKSLFLISAGIIVVMFALLTYSNHREMTNLRKKIAQTENQIERKAIH